MSPVLAASHRASCKRGNGSLLARYRPVAGGAQKDGTFSRKVDAQRWLDEVTASIMTGQHVDPKTARTTVEQWCEIWIEGYKSRRPGAVKMARVHIGHIKKELGSQRIGDVRPSQVRAWTAWMTTDGRAKSYVYAIYRRLAQIMGDAGQDGPSRDHHVAARTSPGAGAQRPYVAHHRAGLGTAKSETSRTPVPIPRPLRP